MHRLFKIYGCVLNCLLYAPCADWLQWGTVSWKQSCKNMNCSYVNNHNQIRSQFCTCHDSSAVMTCAKLWPDWIIKIKLKELKRTFTIMRSKIMGEMGLWHTYTGIIQGKELSQWGTMLNCNIVSHWLSPYQERYLGFNWGTSWHPGWDIPIDLWNKSCPPG